MDKILIDGQVWYDGDIAQASNGQIFQLHCWPNLITGDLTWTWLAFGTEVDWLVGGDLTHASQREAPIPPLQKMRLVPAEDY